MTIGLSKLLVNCFAQSSVNFNLNVNTASVEAESQCIFALELDSRGNRYKLIRFTNYYVGFTELLKNNKVR